MIGGVAAGLSHYLDSMYGLEQYLYFSFAGLEQEYLFT
jgi:hypothetical protein